MSQVYAEHLTVLGWKEEAWNQWWASSLARWRMSVCTGENVTWQETDPGRVRAGAGEWETQRRICESQSTRELTGHTSLCIFPKITFQWFLSHAFEEFWRVSQEECINKEKKLSFTYQNHQVKRKKHLFLVCFILLTAMFCVPNMYRHCGNTVK